MVAQVKIENGGAYLVKEFSNVVFLSGGFGSEVNKRLKVKGVDVDSVQKGSEFKAPIHAPGVVKEVHQLYADAGADVLTADTFNASVSRQSGNIPTIQAIIKGAVGAAQEVSDNHRNKPLVALSLTSSGDCYTPEDTPDDETLIKEHALNVELLAPHGDFILAETLPTLREGSIIAEQCQKAQKPFLMSFVVDEEGDVLDGSSMERVVETILKSNSYCMGVLVNCGDSVSGVQKAVKGLNVAFNANAEVLRGKRFGAYPNGFKGTIEENEAKAEAHACSDGHCNHGDSAFEPESLSREEYADEVEELVENGASIVGGCCGTTPEHVETYVARIENHPIAYVAA